MSPVIIMISTGLHILSHDSWCRSYEVGELSGTRRSITFQDGHRIFFEVDNVDWAQIARTVAMWEQMIS